MNWWQTWLKADHKRWWAVSLLGAGLVLTLFLLVTQTQAGPPPPPRLIIESTVAGDFEALAQETWVDFITVFQGRVACFGDVRLQATATLNSRAVYDPATATVTVRVPATAALLQGALIHEWAHHLEFQCDAHRQLRADFLAAQKLPPTTPWRTNEPLASHHWANSPSEQYAEAAIQLVLGRRQIPTGARINPEAVEVLRNWAAGN